MAIPYINQTIWASSPAALGLTQEQWEFEQKWLRDFNNATDKLDWEQWKDYWGEDAFFKYGSLPQIQGKPELGNHFKEFFKAYKWMKHEPTRHSFDIAKGIIYQTLTVTCVIQGDESDTVISTGGVTLIHKGVGESQLHGLEVHADLSTLIEWKKEVASRAQANATM